MNRGHVLQLQSSTVQQLMPNWLNNNNMRPILQPHRQLSPPFLPPPSNHFPQSAPPQPPSSSWHDYNHQQVLPESWNQLLMGGVVVEEDKSGFSHIQQQAKKLENWEELLMLHHQQQQQLQQAAPTGSIDSLHHDVKQENSSNSYHVFGCNTQVQTGAKPTWPHMIPVSSPNSCVTSLSSNMLDFSNSNTNGRHPPPDRSSECISTATGGTAKKARVHPSSTQTTFKVRKEKLGDRVTALHQMVSPFGKTDTASVLLEAIGYIRFLQNQIEALSFPYLGSGSGNNMRQQQSVQGEKTCSFPEDPGQLLNDNCLKRKASPDQDSNEKAMKDLKSRGLCLVPISCTIQVESDLNGADYWGPAALGGVGTGGFH